ncbi:hypothetical protein F5X98DRAFT_381529 [Xylaria grammica]|nr:hypothetical protein F5X98DRAFT_381529 [Xylaria grammica]
MFSSLIKIVDDIALGRERRKVKKYLDEATSDSVAADLGKVLLPRLGSRERGLLQTTFDMHCIEDSAQQKYWNEESFRRYIRSRHSADVICDPVVRLLWRSFHFYAYHPFPRGLQYGKVDYDAFQRAALLTVFQCDRLLGTRELDWFWRNDAAYFRKASVQRIFRSIVVPESTAGADLAMHLSDMTCVLSDAADVLVMVGPQFIHAMPSPEQLEIVARKLSSETPDLARRTVRREEVSILINLLLRVRLEEEKWGSCWNFGDIVESRPVVGRTARPIVNSIIGKDGDRSIISEQFPTIVDLMPDLQLQFYRLWAVLFQPPAATDKMEQI